MYFYGVGEFDNSRRSRKKNKRKTCLKYDGKNNL